MKKNNIICLSLISGLLCFSAACSDEIDYSLLPPPVEIEGTEGTDDSSITRLAWKETKIDVSFINESKNINVTLRLARTGSSSQETVNARFTTLTEGELDSYNSEHKTSYSLLPEEYYELPAAVGVAADVKQQDISMLIKSSVKELSDISDRQYAAAIRLTADGCETRAGYDLIIVSLEVVTPKFTIVEQSGVIGETEALIAGITEDITKTLTVGLNVDNRWNSKVVFESDPERLQEWVDVYNRTAAKTASLLPSDYYMIGNDGGLEFDTTDESIKKVNIVISAKASSETALSEGEYVLPVMLCGCEGMPFHVNKETVCFFLFTVENPILSLSLASGESGMAIVEAGKGASARLGLRLNTGFQWDETATVSFEEEKNILENLVNTYNEGHGTNYSLLPDGTYALGSVELTRELTATNSREYVVEITTSAETASGEYLLPVQMKSCSNNAIALKNNVVFLQVSVMKKLDLTGRLSTNSEGISVWAYVPVTKLADGNFFCSSAVDGYPYYPDNPAASNKNNAGYWQSEWTFDGWQYSPNKDQAVNYDTTYGVYIDIDIEGLNLSNAARFVMWASRSNYPKNIKFYTTEDGMNWAVIKEVQAAAFNQTTTDGYVNGEYKTGISIRKYESEFFTISPATRKIRISILTNANDVAMNTGSHIKEVSMDELELYGY